MAKLALNGGEPVVKSGLGKSWPIFDETEENAMLEVLRSGAWNRREKVDEVGEKFAAFHDAKYGIPLANGTVALQCALKAAGVSAGDEVIVPALTFVATGTSAVCVNAVPVIVDVDPLTYNIAPDAIEKAITPRTRAIIPVHNGGYPADMDAIMEIAERHNLKVIEDCAHAHGSQWRGKGMGSIGHLGAFSFQMGKTLTCGEGGMVITNDEALAEKAGGFAQLNMRMTNFQATLLLCQLERFAEQVETRERNIAYLAKGMEAIDGLHPIPRDARVTRWCFYYWDSDSYPRSSVVYHAVGLWKHSMQRVFPVVWVHTVNPSITKVRSVTQSCLISWGYRASISETKQLTTAHSVAHKQNGSTEKRSAVLGIPCF